MATRRLSLTDLCARYEFEVEPDGVPWLAELF
jgi:hypothetical protein